MERINILKTRKGKLHLPAFMPDATYGSIKSVAFNDLERINIPAIVTTTLHLEQSIGSGNVAKLGGLHKFFNWDRPILTDSGGFQVFSLVHSSDIKENKITENGAYFKNPINGSLFELTPEISQQVQHNLDSDIRIVLDEPTLGHASQEVLELSTERTTRWAKRSKDEFLKLNQISEAEFNQIDKYPRPLLFAVIQGGDDLNLRKKSFEELYEIGFDGYCWGGWPTKEDGSLNEEVGGYMADMIPKDKVAYAMGVGTPDDMLKSYKLGWNLFDCVLPTRNARHGFLYVTKGEGDKDFENYSVLHIKRNQYKFDERPIDQNLNYPPEEQITRSYLRHLIRTNESAGHRYATMHNLRFYNEFIRNLEN